MCGRLASLVLGAILLLGAGSPLAAQTREELGAAMRRLRQVEASLEPLPDSGITRDVGAIAVVEHDGSSYDQRLPDGTLNYEARVRVGRRFYETHADEYDFLVVFTNFEFATGNATAFHLFGRNDVEGIGKFVGSAADVFGSPARLKGWVDMAAVSRYRQQPLSVAPGDPGFVQTLNVLAHEVGHQWLAEARYKAGGATHDDLLGQDEAHWSYLLDSDASLYYGASWRDNGDGTFTAAYVKERYSALDLYLMGLLPKEKVSAFRLLQNPSIDRHRVNREGEVVAAAGATEVRIDQLIDEMGSRRPDWLHSQKEFRLGFLFLTQPGTEPSPEDMEAVEHVRRAFGAHFFALTHGVAWADTTLVETPSSPRAAVPDLERALAWLAARQGLDGSWSDSAETRLRDTGAAVWALATAGATGPAWQRGITWLQQARPESLDFRARLASALAPRSLTALERASHIAGLLASQNADGGFGAGVDFSSDALDTALALRAWKALEHPDDTHVRLAVGALGGLANADGGWPAVAGGETSTVVTAEVLLALLDWRETPGASALRASGLAVLMARQNPDGGFGSSPSTAHSTALGLEVLLRAGNPGTLAERATAWLQANQLADGSWAGSPYQTALVLAALRQSLGANLVVPAATLAVAPNPAPEGGPVHVAAHVRNAGREAAPATVARLYDGDPASSPSRGEAPVPALAPAEEAEIAFDYPTQDRAGVRTLYVVADAAGEVRESREDDNTASRALTVEGKLADLVVVPEDVAVSPAGPEVGEGTTITVTVRNAGERSAPASVVLVGVTDPSGTTVHLPLATLPALAPGEGASLSIPWTPSRAGRHVVRATADARYEVPESDETNNAAERSAKVVDRAPEGAELAVISAVLVPDRLTQLPQEIDVRAVVENQGRTRVESTVAVFDGDRGGLRLGEVPVPLDARASVPIALRVTVNTPGVRVLVLVVDPDNQIAEADETDNVATVPLTDARTLDLELDAGSVTPSSLNVESGETITVTFDVHNRGTVDVPLVPVQLANSGSGRELARVDIDVPAGQVRTATLAWRTETPGDIPLAVRVDPFDLLRETREDNNAAALSLTVRPSGLPNLAVSGADIAFAPDPPREGETATVSAVVRNLGVVPAGPFALRFFVGDPDQQGALIGEASIAGLGRASATTAAVTWSPVNARGSLGLFVVADPSDQVEESDESDNGAFRPFQATGLPDLVLTTADVVLEPGYPRVGEEVAIRATVRNMGGQASAATSLRAVEGGAATGVVVGVLSVPELAPGAFASVSLAWTPSSPPGERSLALDVDPDGLVVEQDEGNNEARRTVVVQDADLYLSEPFFSPNGDGLKDQTTLAWRATGRVGVVVSNARGQVVKRLVTDGPASGSVTWDGRDERGVLAWDGGYTVTLTGEGGHLLGRALVDLDTNRSPIHEATGPPQLATRNLTCALPRWLLGPAWMPAEEDVLFIVRYPEPDFPAGLLRVGLDGSYGYVVKDDWYRQANFAATAPVSPDGREVLVADGGLFAVDLATGGRRPLGDGLRSAAWSPDGRFILFGDTVLARDGSLVADLDSGARHGADWAWSPTSDRLAGGGTTEAPDGGREQAQVTIVARDGALLDQIPLSWDEGRAFQYFYPEHVVWRSDGRIVVRIVYVLQDDRESEIVVYVVDPETRTAKRVSVDGTWSPDGSRVLDSSGKLWLEDGTSLGFLIPGGASVSPRSSAASYTKGTSDDRPGSVCGGKSEDTFVVSMLANLTAQLDVARLPGDTGLLVKGTATDRNLERFQLDYASRDEPTTWHPIGPAFDVPVVDDVFTVWVPPAPGTYVVRLSVYDRAGNARVLTRIVRADRVPALANFTQTEYFISPKVDGVKDEVTFRYLVLAPTRLDVRILGPEPTDPAAPAAREVRRLAFEYPETGPQSFTWKGTDDADQVVPDGRYTVLLNDLPFRVEVDNTPPEVALAYVDPRKEAEPYLVEQPDVRCRQIRIPPTQGNVELATVVGDQSWHVVDRHLKSWVLRSPAYDMGRGTDPVYVPETDGSGLPVLDGGVPRVRREGGRPVDRKDPYRHFQSLAAHPIYTLQAEDLAGNRSEITAPPPAEALWMLGAAFEEAGSGCRAFPVSGADVTEDSVAGLRPENGAFLAGTSLYPPEEEENVRFSFQPLKGGLWTEVPLGARPSEGLWSLPIDSFESMGIDLTRAYRGRFLGHGDGGEIQSERFTFRPCEEWLQARSWESVDPPGVVINLGAKLHVPLTWARAHVWQRSVDSAVETDLGYFEMAPGLATDGAQTFQVLLPKNDCTSPYRYVVEAQDANGRRYGNREFVKACQRLTGTQPGLCQFAVKVEQRFLGCEASPDDLHLRVYLLADEPVVLEVQAGPEGAVVTVPPLAFPVAHMTAYGWPYRDFVLDAKAWPESAVPARASLRRQSSGDVVATDEKPVFIDRTPPKAEVLLPPEGGTVCAAKGPTGSAVMDMVALGEDPSPLLGVEALLRRADGTWEPLGRVCAEDDAACRNNPKQVSSGRPLTLGWDVTRFDSGDHDMQLHLCDRSGNASVTPRHFYLTREAPSLRIQSVSHAVFSPNADGHVDDTIVVARLAQAVRLTAEVRQGDAKGPVVRTLFAERPSGASDVAAVWDGLTDGGAVAPDGPYFVVFRAADACGGATEISTRVEVDTVPPEVEISEPTGGQRVSASVDVLGRATDLHFALWNLDLACGASGEWSRLATRTNAVAPGSYLARWDTSRAPPGECRLRLVAEDRAENRSPEAFATATVERGELLQGVSATPDVFSPNGDGRRETATLGYALLRAARVRLEVRDEKGQVVRTFETGQAREAGSWSQVWDGLADSGKAAAEGLHVVWVRAVDPAVSTVYEEKAIRLDLDRTPPQVAVSRPVPDGFVSPASTVRGSVTDRNLALFTVSVAPAGSAAVELARGSQGSSADSDLAPLSSLAEGPHVLHVLASDTAENETQLDRPFVVDATPPRAAIQSPANGAVLRRGDTPIPIIGLVGDDHLESWTLRFGTGTEPAVFHTVGQGQQGGNGIPLGSWDVRFVPDGVYTLSLVAIDRAGLSTESRVTVTLDSLPPTVALSSPAEGGYVTAPGPIVGTATDANLASWELASAPGGAAAAFQWSPLASGTTSVADGTLTDWSPLPPDGVYTLRVTARDKVELNASTRVTVTVDTTPPAMPTGLKAKVTKAREGYGSVVATWNPNTEPDLAGYRVERAAGEWTDLLGSPAWDDGERVEGRYTYRVLAEDKAGNQSLPATLVVLVDLTPPLVSFSAPAADASVAGAVDVRGTAWSADDFAEYRLFVGEGAAPASWRLLRRSSVPVAAGTLGEWLALADGPYVLALEAEDTNGNEARVTRRVVVDTLPPEPPVLVAVAKEPAPADWLVPSWQPSPSTDVIGTLVYRNGRLANSTSVVLGDRRGFLVPGTSYQDPKLPDGEHCYHVVAMDGAGNESVPSNVICQSLDNRAPRALIVQPPDGTRFGYPVRVVAETPDLDVTSVRFERRASGAADWVGFGEVRAAPPWETTLDPKPPVGEELSAGPHELRAVATDGTGNTDPDPARVTVVYGDTTPPPAPTGLVARVDGADVTLTWTPVDTPDLASYRLYRDGERIAEGLTEPRHVDSGLAAETYACVVTAVDADGNESAASAPAEAIVYGVRLEEPAWPVVGAPFATIDGEGARPRTTVKVLREGTGIAETAGTGGAFRVEGVPLVPDGNVLQARGEDAAGNRSLPSNEIVVIANTPPAAVTGLEAQVNGAAVSLRWAPVADPDLVGYVVRRDGERLTATATQDEAAAIDATSRNGQAPQAFDGNPATAWTPEMPGTGTWTVTFPASVLVEQVRLRFASPEGSNPGVPADYTILARWQDRDLPIVRVRGNTRLVVEHRLPAPFLTTALRVALDSAGGLAEVTLERLDAVPAGTESFPDEAVPDGRHHYEVTAIDRYGAEGAAGAVEVAIGDVDPPSRPTGLVATPVVRDVRLTWNANRESDVTHYVVLRDGARIGTSTTASSLDPGRPNGTYRYAVIAVDAAGHESGESDPADATIDVQPVPPAVPVILEPTDAAHPITLAVSRTDVAGRADAGSLVTLEVDGEARGAAPAAPGFRAATRSTLGAGSDVALSPDGRWAAWSASADAISVQDLGTGGIRLVPHGGAAGAEQIVFSPDGSALAFGRPAAGPPYLQQVAVLRLTDGSVSVLISGDSVPFALAWSPDGAKLAVSMQEHDGGSLRVIDVATGGGDERGRSSGIDTHLRWSPDGARLAFIRSWWDIAAELHVLDLASSRVRVLDPEPLPSAPPSWSADGRRLAWTTAGAQPLRVRVQDLDGEEPPTDITEAGSDALDARFSPDGDWLSFVRLTHLPEGTTLRSVHAIHLRQGLRVTVSEPREAYGLPDGHDWLGGRLGVRVYDRLDVYAPEAGRFVIRDVALAPGENRLVAQATDSATGLASTDSETVIVTVPEAAFPDLSVLPAGIVSLPPVPLAARPAQLRVRVENHGAADAGETDVIVRVVEPGGSVVLDTRATLSAVVSGGAASLQMPWTPAVAAHYTVQVEVDPDGRVEEASETNNVAERVVTVVAEEGLAAELASDRASYPSLSTAHVTVLVANAGTPFTGVARITVEDAAGAEVALLDERAVSLEWGRSASFAVDWSVGTTPAGRYAFRVRVRATEETEPSASAERPFDIEPGLAVLARVRPQLLTVVDGAPAGLVLSVENHSTNVTLDGATARLRVQLEGVSGPAPFETVRTLPSLPTGGAWGATDVWPVAHPAGRYVVTFEVKKGDVVLATATAILTVEPAAAVIRGTLAVEPAHVLSGQPAEARLSLENRGTAAVSGYPLAVEVVSGPEARVLVSVPATVDLAVGESRPLTVKVASSGIAPGPYVVRLRGGASHVTLARSRLVVHGLIAPPSPHAPADRARVDTAHPLLVVNDASSPEGAALFYEFELFGDEGLTQTLPGARGLPETPSRTSWPVAAALAEDTTYWWRARATDDFSTSAWCAVTAFTVDALNRPPTAPVPDTPVPGARVASRQPELTVRNAIDPERQVLTYEFRLAADEGMSVVVAAEAGVAEGLGLTSWTATKILDEDAVYYWSARARTAGSAPEDFSPWSEPVSFRVDSVNGSPTAPRPIRPIGGREVGTRTPELAVANATDPEGDALTYRFEIDARPDLGSPDRQVSAEVPSGLGETAWTPSLELAENTFYYWRAHASDGNTATPSAVASFFVNAVNEPPGPPVPLDPVDGRTVGTATPTLRLRNAVDPDGDPLTYELEVRDADDAVVASAAGVPSGPGETGWPVTSTLGENQAFTWSARASDGQLYGPWSVPAAFRVDAVAEPPTAPTPWLPGDGAVVEERRPSLVVENATSPDRLPLTYTFELEAVAADGSTTPIDRAEGIAEDSQTTAWTPSLELADGFYQWRARASDPQQHGPWSATWRFDVLVDAKPAAPTGLQAVAGDARVRLDWNASPEPDVTGYRVYRSTAPGGPRAFVATVTAPAFDDLGLTNGVTYYYVVTATDVRAESAPSNEAAARPEAPTALVAEVRFDPSTIGAECLLPESDDHDHSTASVDRLSWRRASERPEPVDGAGELDESCHPSGCPDWLFATIELPAGYDPRSIDVASLRLFGSVTADAEYGSIVDSDHDGLAERRVRFRFDTVAPHLAVGLNTATIVGRAGGSEVRGAGEVQVLPLAGDLRVTPRTLERRSSGEDVEARVTFAEGVAASKVSIDSVRLNGVVPVDRVVSARGQDLVVKFDRAAVIGVLPKGQSVEVRVTGALLGLPFAGVDHIRVIE